jgi:hypothetical protein
MRRLPGVLSLVVGCLLLVPSAADAQATLAGTVRDTSGAVLPGVTVEAASPVLIEKVRTAVSDGGGQYRITDLPPGQYAVSYRLAGFNVVRREGVEVQGSGVIPINVEMRVGALEESITVTGETPLVDTQSTRREMVLNADTLKTLPATRSYGALLTSIPGLMTNTGSTSAMATPDMTFFTTHGGRQNEGRVQIDGLPVAASFNGGGVSTFTYDVANAAEMQVLVSGGLGESEAGGPSINLVPQSGGNSFRGTGFYSGAGEWSAADNIDDRLRSVGITQPPALIKLWDVSGTYSGPIKRDRLWFFGNVRNYGNYQNVEGVVANANAGDPSQWRYARNDAIAARTANTRDILSLRLTGQISERNRVSFSHEYQRRCTGSTVTDTGEGCRQPGSDWIGVGTLTASPESWPGYHDTPYHVTQATWSSPLSNRLLLEAGISRFQYIWHGFGTAPPDHLDLIPVTEQLAIDGHRANFTYRGIFDPIAFGYAINDASPTNWRGSASYVTGAHNLKIGYQGSFQKSLLGREANDTLLRYTFRNGVPIGVGYTLVKSWEQNDRAATAALFVQDQWTLGRLTLQGAVRYDRAWSWSPADGNGTSGTSPFLSQPISFPRTVSVEGYNDITTRWGGAYDVFGTGKTALKVNIGKYLQNATNDQNYTANNPAARIVRNVMNRGWVDGNGNFVVDCDLRNPALQVTPGGDTCQALSGESLNFGNANPNLTVINPEILKGWGVRPSDWAFGISVQQEVLPRVSVEVGYNRRWFQNFFVTDNLAVGPEDYQPWTYTAPQDSRLPDGGGYPIELFAITPEAALRGARNYQTFETDYGDARTMYWHGVDVSANARLQGGLTLQGGTSTGRGVRDRCDTARSLPEEFLVAANSPIARFESCHVTEPWMTSVRGLVSYTVPRIDVLVSAQMRSLNAANVLPGLVGATAATNGASLNANTAVPNTVVLQSLGRLPGTALATQTTTVNLLTDGQLYPDERVNQIDMRFAKILRFGDRRLDIGIDLYNLLNSNDTTGFDQSYDYGVANGGEWLLPTSIVSPRFARFNVTVSF